MADIKIEMVGRSFMLRATFGAAREIESQIDLTLAECFDLLRVGRLKYFEAAVIILAGCKAAGKDDYELEGIGDQLFQTKIMNRELRAGIAKYILALTYSSEAAKKKFAEEMEPSLESPETANG